MFFFFNSDRVSVMLLKIPIKMISQARSFAQLRDMECKVNSLLWIIEEENSLTDFFLSSHLTYKNISRFKINQAHTLRLKLV